MTRSFRLTGAVLAVAGLLAACGDDDDTSAATTTTASPGTTAGGGGGEMTAEEIAQCASPDGVPPEEGDEMVFVWGGGLTQTRSQEVLAPAFEEATGVEMVVIGEGGADTVAKLTAGGGDAGYDVVFTSLATLDQARDAGVIAELDFSKLPELEAIPEEYRDPRGEDLAATVTEFAYTLAYNPDELEERDLEPPESIEEVLNPDYGDAMAIFTPPFQSAFAQIAIVNDILGATPDDPTPAIEALADLDEAVRIPGPAELNLAVANGEVAMWFTASASTQILRDEGFPVELVGPGYFSGIYVYIPTGSAHPGAACHFINWVMSEEGQVALQEVNGNLPTRPDTPLREDSLLQPLAEDRSRSYANLVADLPSFEEITEMWNQAAG